MITPTPTPDSPEWRADCLRDRGELLTGKHAHWCIEWDFLPVDETCLEWPCACCRSGSCGVPVTRMQLLRAWWQKWTLELRVRARHA